MDLHKTTNKSPKIFLCDGGCCCAQCGLIDSNVRCGSQNIHSLYVYIEYDGQKILFDTGYDAKYFENTGVQSWLFHMVLPVDKTSIPKFGQLFDDNDINLVIVSHYHPDHICGMKKFINARFIAWGLPISGPFAGFFPSLLPDNYYGKLTTAVGSGSIYTHSKLKLQAFDVFQDDTCLTLILLPGHSSVHCGLLIKNKVFFVADAVWTRASYRESKYPLFITKLAQENVGEYYKTISDLHKIGITGGLDILPSHCPEVTKLLNGKPFIEYIYEKKTKSNLINWVLVTGASGFVGKRLVKYLVDRNIKVIGIGRQEQPNEFYKLNRNLFKYYQCDLTNINQIKLLFDFQTPSHVIHCASLCSAWGNWSEYYNSNVLGTKNLLEISIQHNVIRFVFVSSSSVYVNNYWTGEIGINEHKHTTTSHKTYYNKSKLLAEYEVQKIMPHNQMETIIIRPRGIYGEGDNHLIPTLVKSAKVIPNFGPVQASLTHVENVCHALELALTKGTPGAVYNITDGVDYNLTDIIESFKPENPTCINKLNCSFGLTKFMFFCVAFVVEIFYCLLLFCGFKSQPFITRYTLSLVSQSCTLDITRAKEELDYCPIVTNGINQVLELLNKKQFVGNKQSPTIKTKLLS